jgi:competence protein ComEA
MEPAENAQSETTMDTSAPWRAIEASERAGDETEPPPERSRLGGHQLLLAAAVVLVAVSVGAAVLVASQQGGQVQMVSGASGSPDKSGAPAATQAMLIVEVAGAVAHPAVYSLPVGSRVADAITAAGGYSTDVDPRQAEAQLNLAAKLVDAQVVRVPRRGDGSAAGPRSSGAAPASAGLIDLNAATAEQLDTLPGIGPVTAQKIIASREQQPFQKVDDLVTRKVVPASTLAKFRSLVTVG